MAEAEIKKAKPAAGYPPEEGCYLRGNDYSPVAVVVILRWEREKTPPSIEQLVRVAVESGAALAGTLQTENVGLEKVICNVVSNPNIRYLFNIPAEYVDRFRAQITVLDLVDEGLPDVLRQAVWSSYQEDPTPFKHYRLHDPGAYPEPPLSGKITFRITDPQREPKTDEQRAKLEKAQVLMERIKRSVEARKRGTSESSSDHEGEQA